jgi:NAD(P)-dependent dehydrogenase (short-subunit alcohol dehydrogenase family)
VKPVVLVSDAQTPLGATLAQLYLARGCSVAAVGSGEQKRTARSDAEETLRVDWNRRSPISARNVVLSVVNHFERIDEAVVLLSPSLDRGLLHEFSYEVLERAVDSWVKGSLFLIKGLLDQFRRQNTEELPVLAMVDLADQEEGTAFPPLEAALRGSFEATARSLIASYEAERVRVHGFSGFSPQYKGFAEFIVDTLAGRASRASGRWHRYPPKSGLLSSLKISRG